MRTLPIYGCTSMHANAPGHKGHTAHNAKVFMLIVKYPSNVLTVKRCVRGFWIVLSPVVVWTIDVRMHNGINACAVYITAIRRGMRINCCSLSIARESNQSHGIKDSTDEWVYVVPASVNINNCYGRIFTVGSLWRVPKHKKNTLIWKLSYLILWKGTVLKGELQKWTRLHKKQYNGTQEYNTHFTVTI